MKYTKNKKSVSDIFLNVMVIGFIAAFSIFGFLFIKNIYSQELIPPITDKSLEVLADYGNDSTTYELISSQETNYNNMEYGIDILFLIMWIFSTIVGSIASFYSPKLNKLQLLLFLFIGILVLLIVYNYIYQILDWIVTEFINSVFSASETYLPIFTFYVENFIFINLITIVMYIMINQFKRTEEEPIIEESEFFDNSFSAGNVEEEQ